MTTQWYFSVREGESAGPVTFEELVNVYQDKLISLDHWVWHAGLTEWQPLRHFKKQLYLVLFDQGGDFYEKEQWHQAVQYYGSVLASLDTSSIFNQNDLDKLRLEQKKGDVVYSISELSPLTIKMQLNFNIDFAIKSIFLLAAGVPSHSQEAKNTAIQCLEKLFHSNNSTAQFMIGAIIAYAVSNSWFRVKENLFPPAQIYNHEKQALIAWKPIKNRLEWLERAADNGSKEALLFLGRLYGGINPWDDCEWRVPLNDFDEKYYKRFPKNKKKSFFYLEQAAALAIKA